MATNKFLTIISGIQNFVTAISSSAGVGDANKIVATDGAGKIDVSLLPTGVGAETKTAEATETLAAGNLVNIYNDAGTEKVRLADSSNQRFANGFVLSAVTSGNNATIYLAGVNNGLTGLTPGTLYFLDTVGGVTTTSPTASGSIIQEIGSSLSATEISFSFSGFTLIT